MTAYDIDTSELTRLADDMRAAGRSVGNAVAPVIKKGAQNIKQQMAAEMGASAHFKGAASSISYDFRADLTGVEALIGPKSGRGEPGALANIAYFGTSRGGGTVADPVRAMEAEAPRLEQAIADVLGDLLS